VAVVGLADFNIDIIAKHPGCHIQQFEAQIYAGTEVGCHTQGRAARLGNQLSTLLRGKTSGTYHHFAATGGASLRIRKRGIGGGEINQHIKLLERLTDITEHLDTIGANTRQLTCINAYQGTARPLQGNREVHGGIQGNRFNQRFAHTPGSAGNCYSRH
jgi:hypothetical protein